MNGSNLITKLQAKHDLLKQTLGEGKSDGRESKGDGRIARAAEPLQVKWLVLARGVPDAEPLCS